MSLATTCPTCQTVFRVVEDQLKVSEGWVRCGQCQQVFNALEGLFDLSAPRSTRSAPLTWAPTEPVGFEHDPGPPPAEAASSTGARIEAASLEGGASSTAAETSGGRASSAASREFFSPETAFSPSLGPIPSSARFVDAEAPAPGTTPADPSFDWSPVPGDADLPSVEDDSQNSRWAGLEEAPALPVTTVPATPAFVREVERRARWQRPGMRWALGLLSVGLTLLLLLQVAHHQRDRWAASKPALRPALEVWCRLAACELQAPRVLDALVVDSTTVSRQGNGEAFRLAVQLRNRADYPVAVPHLELNLTDAQGKIILRRVLKPADFRIQELALGPQSDTTWSLDFSSGQRRITGYTVAAFYP